MLATKLRYDQALKCGASLAIVARQLRTTDNFKDLTKKVLSNPVFALEVDCKFVPKLGELLGVGPFPDENRENCLYRLNRNEFQRVQILRVLTANSADSDEAVHRGLCKLLKHFEWIPLHSLQSKPGPFSKSDQEAVASFVTKGVKWPSHEVLKRLIFAESKKKGDTRECEAGELSAQN